MTDKKEEVPTSKELETKDQKTSFAVEGVDALFEEALATMEMGSSPLEKEITSFKEEESEVLWEEPEIRDEETNPSVTVDADALATLQELEVTVAKANEEKEKEVTERKKVYEQLLRVTAEFDNFRKRTQREKEELRRFGHKDVMGDFLDVVDNFERALKTLDGTEDSIREGIEMVHRQFSDILSRHGVKRFKSTGEAFDYTKHQAISVFETAETPPQMVYETFKDGYDFHEQLLRPAMVVVSKAPSATPTSITEADAEASVDTETAKEEEETDSSTSEPSTD